MFKTNINTLQITILNKLQTRYKNARIAKITNNIYRLTLYCLRVYSTFSIITKIVLNNNLKLIVYKKKFLIYLLINLNKLTISIKLLINCY